MQPKVGAYLLGHVFQLLEYWVAPARNLHLVQFAADLQGIACRHAVMPLMGTALPPVRHSLADPIT